jgi:hypothetical protein
MEQKQITRPRFGCHNHLARMGLLANLAQLKLIGSLVVAIACFGFCVVDGRAAAKYTEDKSWYYQLVLRDSPSLVLYRCALALAVLGILTTVVLLGGIVLALLELSLPPIVGLALFGAGAALFFGCLVAASVGISAALYIGVEDSYLVFAQLDSRNYNESDDIKAYVDGCNAYLESQRHNGLRLPWANASFAGTNRRARAGTPSPQEYCLGQSKSIPGFAYRYAYFPLKEKFLLSRDADPDRDIVPHIPPELASGYAYPWYITYNYYPYFYEKSLWSSQQTVPVCYGEVADPASWAEAYAKSDACALEYTSATACAPGWSVSSYQKLMCTLFTYCVEEREGQEKKTLEDLEDIGATQGTYSYNYTTIIYQPPYGSVTELREIPQAWILPKGWDDVSALKSYFKGVEAERVGLYIAHPMSTFRAFNLTFLCVGVVGWVFLIAGIVVGFLGGGGGGGEDDKA